MSSDKSRIFIRISVIWKYLNIFSQSHYDSYMITVRFDFGFGTGGTIQIPSNNQQRPIMFAVGMECFNLQHLWLTISYILFFLFLCCTTRQCQLQTIWLVSKNATLHATHLCNTKSKSLTIPQALLRIMEVIK